MRISGPFFHLTWLLLSIGCSAPGTPFPDPATDEAVIRERYHLMDSLFALDRMGDIASVYHDSARIVSTGRIITGKAGIEAYWSQLDGSGVSWDHAIEELTVRGDRAIQTGTSELHYRSADDTLVSLVRYTLIWKKDSTGNWWIDRDHYTPMPRVIHE